MDALAGKVLGFILVLTRLGAFFAVAPIFSWKSIPVRVKAAVVILLSFFYSSLFSFAVPMDSLLSLDAMLLVAVELIYGLALGYVCALLFLTVQLGGRIAEREMGLTMANILDPLSGEQSQSLSLLLEMVFVLLFMTANGHHIFLLTLSKSYQSFPPGTMPDIAVLLKSILAASATMLMAGLKLAAPILAAFLLLMVVLGVMARVAPEANILFLSLPMRVGMGLLMVGIFLPFINGFVKQLVTYMEKLLPL